jgi:Peptidase M50B-like
MTASALAASLQRIGQVQAHLPGPVSMLLALFAAAAAFVPLLWPVTRHITVIAHEGAHATMASAVGRKVDGIKFKLNADGATNFSGSAGGKPGFFAIAFIGYLGPSAFGIGAAELIRIGYIVAVLWIGLAGLVAIMLTLRRSFGIVTVFITLVLVFLVAAFATVGVQVVTAYAITWFLLVSSVQIIRIRGKDADDAGKLQGMTKIPAGFWSKTWLAGAILALVFGGIQLL